MARAAKTKAAESFTGFPAELPKFLADLDRNNDKAWFEAHRGLYEQLYAAPGKAFAAEYAPVLSKLIGTTFTGRAARIHRDVRFSKDKSPYKAHLDIAFAPDDTKGDEAVPMFFFRMMKDRLYIGTGIHAFDPDWLKKYRRAVADEKSGKALSTIVEKLRAAGYEVGEVTYKKVPKDFEPDHPRAELLKHGALYVHLDARPVPRETRDAEFGGWLSDHFKRMRPLYQWMRSV